MIRVALKMASVASKRVAIPANGVDYRGKVVLAPMVRSGELPSRLLALHYGADLVWGPETIDKAMIGTTRRENALTGAIEFTRWPSHSGHGSDNPNARESVIYRLHPERERGRLIFQLGTAGPEKAVTAARLVAGDVAGIDVNAGCPKSFSTSGGMGAALLRDPERLASILEALVAEVGGPFAIGISVKIRLLETPEATAALVRRLVRTGITGLTVHCRTTPMRPREHAIRHQLAMIGDICREAGVACLMNGDVTNRDEGLRLAAEYGVDGAMIATAAEADSSVFRAAADGGRAPWREVVAEYLRFAISVENKWTNSKFMLAQLLPGKSDAIRRCQLAKNYLQACQFIGLDDLCPAAAALDSKRGIDTRPNLLIERGLKHLLPPETTGAPAPKKKRDSLLDAVDTAHVPQNLGHTVALAT